MACIVILVYLLAFLLNLLRYFSFVLSTVDQVCVLSRLYTEDERLQTRRPHFSWKEPRAIPRKWPMVFLQPLIRNYSVIFFCFILLLDFVCLFTLQNLFLSKNKCQLN